MLEVEGIDTFYGLGHILFGVSLKVNKGQVVCLLGRNGAGKTTTLKSIMGLNPPKKGKIRFKDQDITGMPPYKIAKAGIARTFQIPQIFPSLTVEKSISVGSRFGSRNGLDEDHVAEILRFVELAEEKNQKTGIRPGALLSRYTY